MLISRGLHVRSPHRQSHRRQRFGTPHPGGTVSRPRSEEEYLARLVPPSVAGLSRRSLLRGVASSAVLLGGGSLLAACGSDSSSGSGSKTVSLGSNQSD